MNTLELIGNTPLVELFNIEKEFNLNAHLFAKLDMFNLTGSAKDRAALYIVGKAEKDGRLKQSSTIIEPTSGNTGIALAAIGKIKGYKVLIVMPDSMSVERIKMIKAYGAEVILTPGILGMKGAIDKAEELSASIKGSIIAGQFDNPANVQAHFETTGPEIYSALNGKIDAFVAGVGTGGTVTGTGMYLKQKNNDIKVVAVEPASSPLLTKGKTGTHAIQGIGPNFIPKILDIKTIDYVEDIDDNTALEYTRLLCQKEAIMAGISSGAALAAAIKYAQKPEMDNKNIVVFFVDGGTRYLSSNLY